MASMSATTRWLHGRGPQVDDVRPPWWARPRPCRAGAMASADLDLTSMGSLEPPQAERARRRRRRDRSRHGRRRGRARREHVGRFGDQARPSITAIAESFGERSVTIDQGLRSTRAAATAAASRTTPRTVGAGRCGRKSPAQIARSSLAPQRPLPLQNEAVQQRHFWRGPMCALLRRDRDSPWRRQHAQIGSYASGLDFSAVGLLFVAPHDVQIEASRVQADQEPRGQHDACVTQRRPDVSENEPDRRLRINRAVGRTRDCEECSCQSSHDDQPSDDPQHDGCSPRRIGGDH